MTIVEKIESKIDLREPIQSQLAALSEFDNITSQEILEISKTGFKSGEAGILLEYLGYARLKPHSNLFFEFLMDFNWPAARGASRMLLQGNEELIPEIKRIFKEVPEDDTWHNWILLALVQFFDGVLIDQLKNDLIILVQRADIEGASITALRILKENEIITQRKFDNLYQHLSKQFEGDIIRTSNLNEELKRTIN